MDKREYWNMRADTFGGMKGMSKATKGYMPRFIEMLDLREGQSVFDMGCANGTLAIPLARAGHFVCARDFSPRMIELLNIHAQAENLPIDAQLMAWEDDWEACGIEENSCDVAVASRSLAVGPDMLLEALTKLDRVAREKVAVTVSASLAPAYDKRLLEYLGREVPIPRGHVEVIDALATMGRLPTLDYIPFERPMRFDNWDMAVLELRNFAGREEFDVREQELFEVYAREHFKVEEDEDGATVYQLDYKLPVAWAFITWPTREVV